MPTLDFIAVIKIRGVNPFILVSALRANAIRPGWRKPLPVLVRINGKPAKAWPINMMPVGDGSFYLYLHGDVRKASGTVVGDRVRVEIDFDPSYRNGPQHPMPAWFRQELAGNPQAKKNWMALVPSGKKEILRYFSRLNSPEARTRNLARALHVLSGNPADLWDAHGRTDRRRYERRSAAMAIRLELPHIADAMRAKGIQLINQIS